MEPHNKTHYMILAALRKIWQWSVIRRQALTMAWSKERREWKCKGCGAWLGAKERVVDHISPVIPVAGFDNWDNVIKRMLEPALEDLQVLCKPCHKAKSNAENAERRKFKGEKKNDEDASKGSDL